MFYFILYPYFVGFQNKMGKKKRHIRTASIIIINIIIIIIIIVIVLFWEKKKFLQPCVVCMCSAIFSHFSIILLSSIRDNHQSTYEPSLLRRRGY